MSFLNLEHIPPMDENLQYSLEMLFLSSRVQNKLKFWERLDDFKSWRSWFDCFIYLFSVITMFLLYWYSSKNSQSHNKNLAKSLPILETVSRSSDWTIETIICFWKLLISPLLRKTLRKGESLMLLYMHPGHKNLFMKRFLLWACCNVLYDMWLSWLDTQLISTS